MKKEACLSVLVVVFLAGLNSRAATRQLADSLSSNFSLAEQGCVNHNMSVNYLGNAPASATYIWDFDSAVIISGSGQGPYVVKWETVGMKTVTLTVHYLAQISTTSKQTHIMPVPFAFSMTGGGSYPAGGSGVAVGLNGSQNGILYKLRLNGTLTGVVFTGTGNTISFGLQTAPGSYDALAVISGTECVTEMLNPVTVTVTGGYNHQICMVTFDTISLHNEIIWNNPAPAIYQHVNVYRETFQNNAFEKIAEVPFALPCIYIDTTSFPLVKSDRYKISFVTEGVESEKSAPHKTIHLNINPGIYGFNLIWNYYEGFDFLTYNIYRKIGTGFYELIASVASNVNSYTDFYVGSGIATYYIGVVKQEPCTPGLKSSIFTSTISNIAAAAPIGISEKDQSGMVVYPNPAHDRLMVSMKNNSGSNCRIMIYEPNGIPLLEQEASGNNTQIDVSGLGPGMYLLKVTDNNTVTTRKFIKD